MDVICLNCPFFTTQLQHIVNSYKRGQVLSLGIYSKYFADFLFQYYVCKRVGAENQSRAVQLYCIFIHLFIINIIIVAAEQAINYSGCATARK